MIGLAYFGVTVGAGFASGQEMLQYYVSYGWWGVAGALVNLIVMPITAMTILQYGSYFRAQSHGKVFHSIASMVVAKVMDYGLSIAQFCVGFVMLAGAGSSLRARQLGDFPGPDLCREAAQPSGTEISPEEQSELRERLSTRQRERR